jgi:two-component system cell cycle response regulator
MKVLIAEDDRISAMMLKRALEQQGYEIVLTDDGQAAWEEFQKEIFPIVISDWVMPYLEGPELCRRIRSLNNPHYTYFILLTSKDHKEARTHALEAGADDFIIKPLDRDELNARLIVASRILTMQKQMLEHNQALTKLSSELQTHAEELQHSQKMLQQANRRFADLFEHVPVACFTFDIDGVIHEWNQAAAQLYGWEKTQVLFRSMFETLFREGSEANGRELLKQAETGNYASGLESEDVRIDGKTRYVTRSIFPLRGADESVIGGIVANMDVTERVHYERELKALNERLENLAVTDGLTGLKNHRAFREHLNRQFSVALHRQLALSLILLDVDKFKDLNDTFGHPAGDEVLKQVVQIINENSRESDFVARYGGEEFVIVLPSATIEIAGEVAERLRSAIEQASWQYRAVTASFGVATLTPGTPNVQTLIDEADKALYQSKTEGRNRVTKWKSETHDQLRIDFEGWLMFIDRAKVINTDSLEQLELTQAINYHYHWKNHLRTYLRGDSSMGFGTIVDPSKTQLGQWYYTIGKDLFGHLQEFRQIEELLITLHTCAKRLLECCHKNKQELASGILGEMETYSAQIVDLLEQCTKHYRQAA